MCQHSCDRAPWPSSPCCFPSTAQEGDSLSLLSSSTNGASNSVTWPDPCPQERNGAQLQLSPAVQGNKGQFGVQMWSPAPCLHPNHPEFLTQHLSWECGAGLAQQGTDRDVPQPLLICSPSNTSLFALHVRGNVPPQGQKQLPGGPPAPGQSAQTAGTAGQGCSRRGAGVQQEAGIQHGREHHKCDMAVSRHWPRLLLCHLALPVLSCPHLREGR